MMMMRVNQANVIKFEGLLLSRSRADMAAG